MNANDFLAIGYELISKVALNSKYCFELPSGDGIYKSYKLSSGISIDFSRWSNAEKPYYIVIFLGNKFIYELDLTRVVKKDDKYSLYLSIPSNKCNRATMELNYRKVEFPENYLNLMNNSKRLLNMLPDKRKSGYELVQDTTIENFLSSFSELIYRIINAHINDNISNLEL